jgi:predicted peptidase
VNSAGGQYLSFLPERYSSVKQWPLVLFLHGMGERGDDPQRLKTHGLPKLADNGRCFPFVLIAPQCPKGRVWSVEFLEQVLDDVLARYRVDPNRVLLTGISMGGHGAWRLAIRRPERFAALIPIAAWGDRRKISRLGRLPVWAFHGARDRAVPLRAGKAMTDALKKAGGRVKLTVYKPADHVQTWEKAYDNQALYRWMLRQKRRC